jgi:outer membrane protein OmpA-like peptidoglycan-associated protein
MNDDDDNGRWGLWIGVAVGVFIALATVLMLLGGDGDNQTSASATGQRATGVVGAAATAAAPVGAGAATVAASVASSGASAAARDLDAVQDLPLTGELAGKVYFEVGKATLDAPANDTVAKALKEIQAAPAKRIMLSGFHDLSGDPAKNAELAKERAKSVRNALASNGLSADRIVLRKPSETGSGGSPEEARRVEIRLID